MVTEIIKVHSKHSLDESRKWPRPTKTINAVAFGDFHFTIHSMTYSHIYIEPWSRSGGHEPHEYSPGMVYGRPYVELIRVLEDSISPDLFHSVCNGLGVITQWADRLKNISALRIRSKLGFCPVGGNINESAGNITGFRTK